MNEFVIKKFNAVMNELCNTRLIIAEQTISKLLQLVTDEEVLFEIVSESNLLTDYRREYRRAMADDGKKGFFQMPHETHSIITLVTGILYDFDAKNLNIVEFVTKLFPAFSAHESYMRFCREVLVPYEDAVMQLLMHPEQKTVAVQQNETTEISATKFSESAGKDIDFFLRKLLEIVTDDLGLDDVVMNDYALMVKGMLHALSLGDNMLMKVVFTGLRYTFSKYKKGANEITQIEMLLRTYSVIE
jgi:hypothetical protein